MKPNSFFPAVFRQHWHAFTLIELLIVVAIVAILASIAVPNFLEAQTRSKTARAKADMRSIATAIESYRADNNTYPFLLSDADIATYSTSFPDTGRIRSFVCGYLNYQRGGTSGTGSTIYAWGTTLTTPIAYMSRLPLDPFKMRQGNIFMGGNTGYLFASISAAVRCASGPLATVSSGWNAATTVRPGGVEGLSLTDPYPWVPVQRGNAVKKGPTYYISWLLSSVGPNGLAMDSFAFFVTARYYELAHRDCNRDGISNPNYYSISNNYYQPPYDPTNGTSSVGNIFRSSAGQLN